jgi:hypothetical protein
MSLKVDKKIKIKDWIYSLTIFDKMIMIRSIETLLVIVL